MSVDVDLVRHGATVATGVLLGRTDARLSETGERQLRGYAASRRWDRIVSSPLGRAQASAHLLAQPGQPVDIEPGWAEFDFGAWDGCAIADIDAAAYQRFIDDPARNGPPGGELYDNVCRRVAEALDTLFARGEATPTAVVTHAGTIRTAIAITTGLDFSALWRLRIGPGARLRLRCGRDDGGAWWGEIVELVQPSWCDP